MAIVALAIITIVPLLLLAWYYRMYTDIGRSGFTGGGLRKSGDRGSPERESSPESQ